MHLSTLAVVLLLAEATGGDDQRAAAEAASYWRGRRIQAFEEPNLPAPIIDTANGTINYNGFSTVQECMEYYVDKFREEPLKQRLLQRELAAAEARGGSEKAPRPRGIIAYLLMENADRTMHQDLILSIRCLGKFFRHYPVAVFYTNGTTSAELAWISHALPKGMQLLLEEVEMDFPESLKNAPGGPDGFLAPPKCTVDDKYMWLTHRSCGCRCPAWRPQCWPLNWMHATRFFTAGLFRTRTFQTGDYDFFMRLDTDLFFVAKPVLDPFRLMAERGCVIVYDRLSREAPGCFDGFDERTVEFVRETGYDFDMDDDILQIGSGPAAAGGQWTVGDARLFTSPSYLKWADFAASGIYSNRWADQLLLVRGAALFGPRASIWEQTAETAATSICLAPLFPEGSPGGEGGAGPGLVHLKGGFRQERLLRTCEAEEAFS